MTLEPKIILDDNSIPTHKSIVLPLMLAILLYIIAVAGLSWGSVLIFGGAYSSPLWSSFLIPMITISFLLPGYFLQQKAFELFNKSLVKSTLVPILVWVPAFIFVREFLVYIPNDDTTWIDYIGQYLFVPSLSILTGLYISNRNIALFIFLLVIHCLAFSALL